MNRKLDNALIALSACGLVLVAALLAGTPVAPHGGGAPPAPLAAGEDGRDGDAFSRTRAKSARRGLAMPYFSFARGMRRIGG